MVLASDLPERIDELSPVLSAVNCRGTAFIGELSIAENADAVDAVGLNGVRDDAATGSKALDVVDAAGLNAEDVDALGLNAAEELDSAAGLTAGKVEGPGSKADEVGAAGNVFDVDTAGGVKDCAGLDSNVVGGVMLEVAGSPM